MLSFEARYPPPCRNPPRNSPIRLKGAWVRSFLWMEVASPTASSCRRGFLVVAAPAPHGSSSSWLLAFAAAACRAMRTWRSSSSGGVLCGCGICGLGGLLWLSWACGVAGFLLFFVLAFLLGACASALASSTHRFLSQRKKQGAPARAETLPAQPATFVVDRPPMPVPLKFFSTGPPPLCGEPFPPPGQSRICGVQLPP